MTTSAAVPGSMTAAGNSPSDTVCFEDGFLHATAEDPHGDRAAGLYPSANEPLYIPRTIITQFQAGHGFTTTGGSTGTGTNVNDTTAGNFICGTQAATVVTKADGATFANFQNTAVTSFDTTNKYVLIRYRLSTAAKTGATFDAGGNPLTWNGPQALHIDLANDSGFANCYRWLIADLSGTLGAGYTYDGEWNQIILSFADATVAAGSPTRTGITAVRLRARDWSQPLTVQWQEVSLVDDPQATWPNGVATICFDDIYSTQYTNARPVLDQYGFRATLAVIRSAIGQSASMTLAQITSLQDDLGWEVGSHADTSTVHAATNQGVTPQALEDDYRHEKSQFRKLGFRGGDTFAFPSGLWTPDVIATVRRYYQSARLNFFKTQETFPPANPYKLRACGAITSAAGGHTASAVNAFIDSAKANRSWLILIFHKIVTTTPAVTTECSLTDFQSVMTHLAASGMPVRTIGEVMRTAQARTGAANLGS